MRQVDIKVDINERISLLGDFPVVTGEIELDGDDYKFVNENFEITSKTQHHKTGINVRQDKIKNISDKPLTLRKALSVFTYPGGEYEVFSQYNEWCSESEGVWAPLVNEITSSAVETRLCRSGTPFVAVRSLQNDRGTVFHIIPDSTWEYKVRRLCTSVRRVFVELGMSTENFSYTLNPGETLELPEILYYDFKNKTDLEAYKLHRYCNEKYPSKRMPVVYNTWMADFDGSDFDFMCKQLDIANRLGIEYFVVDAGWFGGPGEWFGKVGDWHESENSKLCGRLKELADKVRSYGMHFGIWFEIERASLTSNTYKEHPEFYFVDKKQAFLDFANPKAVDYLIEALAYNIEKYGIEYIKSDSNVAPSFDSSAHSFREYFRGYKEFNEKLRARFPSLYIENCGAGGARMAPYCLSTFDSCWMSDNHSLYAQLDIFKNTLIRMPSRVLETWITVASTKGFREGRHFGAEEKLLVSGDGEWRHVEAIQDSFLLEVVKGGPIGFTCDLCDISEDKLKLFEKVISEFKAEREFWLNSEAHILIDTNTVLALQYNDESFKTVKISIFVKIPHQTEVTVYPVLDEGKYLYDGKEYTSSELEKDGILLKVGTRYTAQSIELKKI